jgi:hypothetical protein
MGRRAFLKSIAKKGDSMRKQKGDAELIAILFMAVAILVASYGISKASCEASWRESGMRTKYGWPEGCLVEAKPGKWIPEERYREIDE